MPSRGTKRRRMLNLDPSSPAQDKHQRFTQWAKDRGVEIFGVEPTRIPGRGIGLVTTRQIRKDDRLLFIPEKAMWKPNDALLQYDGLQKASPQAQLAYSALSAVTSPGLEWKLWEDVLPMREDFEASMPMCWPENFRKLLPPPVHQPLARQLSDFQKDWEAVKDNCEKYHHTQVNFKYWWMIVNSRSFHWKPPRGASKAGAMVMCPFIDYINHGPTGSGCNVTQNAQGYKVVADRDYSRPIIRETDDEETPGEEVLATYGAHSNDKLLVHYGFVCTSPSPSPDDFIRLDHLLLPVFSPSLQDQLRDTGYLGAYALSPSTNELCFKTEVAVRAKMLTANEWEYYIACGEDLSGDKSEKVRGFVRELLKVWREGEVRRCIGLLEGMGDAGRAGEVLMERWRQIERAVDAF